MSLHGVVGEGALITSLTIRLLSGLVGGNQSHTQLNAKVGHFKLFANSKRHS